MNTDKEIEDFVFATALENAVGFAGKANPKAIFGKVISKFPEIKEDMTHFRNVIENITKQVNSMDLKDQTRKLSDINPDFFKKKKKRNLLKNKMVYPTYLNTLALSLVDSRQHLQATYILDI